MPTKITTSAAAVSIAATTAITTNEDAVQQQISSKAAQVKADTAAISAADDAKQQSNAWFSGLSAKDQAKPANIQKHNDQLAAAEQAKEQAEEASAQDKQDLAQLQNQALPAAVEADHQATQAVQAREKAAEDTDQANKQQAADNKERSSDAARATDQKSKQLQQKSSADVVGSAASGSTASETSAASAAPVEASVAAVVPNVDGYSAPKAQSGTSRSAALNNSVLPGAADEQQESRSVSKGTSSKAAAASQTKSSTVGTAAVVYDDAGNAVTPKTADAASTPKSAAVTTATTSAAQTNQAGKLITQPTASTVGASSTGATTATPVTAAAVSSTATTAMTGTSSTSSTPLTFDDLTDAQKAHVHSIFTKIKEAAKSGDVKKTEDAFLQGISQDDAGQSSGADSDDTTKTGSKSKKGTKTSTMVGAASAKEVTPAGNEALSSMTGATGKSASATQKGQVAGLVATNTIGGSGKLSKTVGAASGKSTTVGDSATDGTLYSGFSVTANSEVGKAYSGGMSPMELVQMVMLKAFQEAGDDVQSAAELMQTQTDAKNAARQSQDSLRNMVSYTSGTGAMDATATSASNSLDSISSNIDAIGDDNQVLMIRLQNLTQLMTTMSQAASNVSKNLYDTEKSIIGQIGH